MRPHALPQALFAAAANAPQAEAWRVMGAPPQWQALHETLPAYDADSQLQPFSPARLEAQSGAPQPNPQTARAQGYADGLANAAADMADKTARLQASIAQLEAVYSRQVHACEADLARLALLVAEQIICAELPARSAYTMAMARHATQLLGSAAQLTLRLCPQDATELRRLQPELCARPGLRLVEDETLEGGGVIAESPEGRVDASVAARLRAMGRALLLADAAPP